MNPNQAPATGLVALQQNVKTIRNPFGFDFYITYDGGKKKNRNRIRFPGDNKPRTMIGPLATVIATHLYQLIRNKYHDEQVEKIRAASGHRESRKYSVPRDIENKIWFLITGEQKHQTTEIDDLNKNVQIDMSALDENIAALDNAASSSTTVPNISKFLDQANAAAIDAMGELPEGQAGRIRGTAGVAKPTTSALVNSLPANVTDADQVTLTPSMESSEMFIPDAPIPGEPAAPAPIQTGSPVATDPLNGYRPATIDPLNPPPAPVADAAGFAEIGTLNNPQQ